MIEREVLILISVIKILLELTVKLNIRIKYSQNVYKEFLFTIFIRKILYAVCS